MPSRAGLHHVWWWFGEMGTTTLNVPPPFLFPQLSMQLCLMPYGLEYPLGQLSWQCPLPAPWAPSASSFWLGVRSRKGCGWVSSAVMKTPCATLHRSSSNPKHTPMWATMEKIHSAPVKTSTCGRLNSDASFPFAAQGCRIFSFPEHLEQIIRACWHSAVIN